jgi:CheY-like chemotaxis protein
MNILIIEDDARIADFLGRGLRAEGHRVDIASDGRQGLEAARQAARDAATDGRPTVLAWGGARFDHPGGPRKNRASGCRVGCFGAA